MSDPNSEILEPEDSERSESLTASPVPPAPASAAASGDTDAEVPVPVAMEPAEIDERAQVIEALNRSEELP